MESAYDIGTREVLDYDSARQLAWAFDIIYHELLLVEASLRPDRQKVEQIEALGRLAGLPGRESKP